MDDKELKQILSTKAPAYQRSLIEIPKDSFVPHYSSLTDYLDRVVGYEAKMLSKVDQLIIRYRLGAVMKIEGGHYGTVLPRINRKGMVVGGNVIYFNAKAGTVFYKETLINNLYSWYAFDYYVDPDVFFGEHLYLGRRIAVVQEEKTALLGTKGDRLSFSLMTSAMTFGRSTSGASSKWMTVLFIVILTSI